MKKAKTKKDKKDLQLEELSPSLFKVSGNLIRKLGGESISNKNVAILELIKNSYDAKANKVEIVFDSVNTTDGKIIISDNGRGMDYSDLISKWMTIATSNKSKIKNNGDRVVIGEKGIGRLSAESLGKNTILCSYPRNEYTGYKILFDWEKYQSENVLIDQVQNKTFKFQKTKNKCGTALEISNLNHDWNDSGSQESLLRDINLLNPINKQLNSFRVAHRISPSLASVPTIKKGFLNKATYKLKTRLSGGVSVRYEFIAKKRKKEGLFTLERKLNCGDAVFELYFFYKVPKYLKGALGAEMSKADSREIINILKNYSGIKLYRDNFRVKPYGEPKSDWIGLDIAAHNQSILPRNNAIIGMVHISRSKNKEIIDTTTREGVLYSDEFIDLISFVRTSIFKIFADLRSGMEPKKKKARKKSNLKKQKIKIISIAGAPEIKEETIFELFGKYDIHPRIKNVSEKLFRDSHFKSAIQDSFVEVISCVKEKSGQPTKLINGKQIELDGDDLMQVVFGCDNQVPKIKFNDLSTSLQRAEQRGFMLLYKGIVALRDKKAHLNFVQKDPQKTIEYLSLASLLVRLLDEGVN